MQRPLFIVCWFEVISKKRLGCVISINMATLAEAPCKPWAYTMSKRIRILNGPHHHLGFSNGHSNSLLWPTPMLLWAWRQRGPAKRQHQSRSASPLWKQAKPIVTSLFCPWAPHFSSLSIAPGRSPAKSGPKGDVQTGRKGNTGVSVFAAMRCPVCVG